MSLRVRLICAAGAWVTFGFLAAFIALSSIFRSHVTAQFFDELFVHVEELERLTGKGASGEVRLSSVFSDPRYDVPGSGFYWQVRDNDRVTLRSASLVDANIDIGPHVRPLPFQSRLSAQGPTGKMFLTEKEEIMADGGIREFMVGTDERHLEELVRDFDRTLVLALGVLGLSMIGSAAAIVIAGLAPFTRLANSLKDVRSGSTETLEGEFPTEVSPLVSEVNSLIASGRKAVGNARAQAGSLAHALKTPLAIVADEAYLLEGRGEIQSGRAIAKQCRVMQLQIDRHIARARASAVSRLPGVRSSLRESADSVVGALKRLHASSTINVTVDIDPELGVAIDSQDLDEILGNLVDNAFKHARSEIRLSVATDVPGLLGLWVEDDGPGLPHEARNIVVEAGARWDQGKPGSGLGLAIVKDLVELYGGRLELADSALGGLRVCVSMRQGSAAA